jgi:hypothetical protein
MSRRRTSGEIVNATLLEVFLSLVFVVMAIAWFERVQTQQAKAEASEAQRSATVRLKGIDSLERTLKVVTQNRDSLRVEVAALRFISPFPPYCEKEARPAEPLTVTLDGPSELAVAVERDFFGHTRGTVLRVSTERFPAQFSAVRNFSVAKGCRYPVRVLDTTEKVSKAEYKRALRAIRTTFYVREYQ